MSVSRSLVFISKTEYSRTVFYYLNFAKLLELPGGFAPLDPLPGLCPGPTGGLKRPPDPSPICVPILHFVPSYAPGN